MTTHPQPPTAAAPPPQEPEGGLCDELRRRANQEWAAEDDDAAKAYEVALAMAEPYQDRLIAAEHFLAQIRLTLAVPADADLCEWLKKLYADWEGAANEADDLRSKLARAERRIQELENETEGPFSHD